MPAALVGIARSQGLRFEIASHATLGRSSASTIVIADPLVSSRHAELRTDETGRYRIVDLGATHGTYVNGAKITDAVLSDGDEIIVGATRLRFEERTPHAMQARSVSIGDEGHVVQHRQLAVRSGFPRADELELPAAASRDYERLRMAFEIGQALAGQHDLDQLLRTILHRSFDLLPASRGAILLRDSPSGALSPRVMLRRDGRDDGVVIPRSILEEVVTKRVGLLSVDASLDQRFERAASVVSQGVRGALSVPMVHDADVVGVIYLDAPAAGVFGERDLDVLSVVANQAALAVRTARLRASLEQQERLAMVAQVAAGLSHDFANILTLILAPAELIAHDPTASLEHRYQARMIETAASHAARLTRRLGTLARGGPSDRRPIDLATFVSQSAELVQQTIGIHIRLVIDVARSCRIVADLLELEQILLNLAFNARDAMGGQGRLEISVTRETIDGRDHAALLVRDSGSGMTSEVAQRVFEPFFTTKPAGRGTGMGLAVVHRLVTETRGRISVESEPGKGTTFRILWPLTQTLTDVTSGKLPDRAQGELVLVVDDDRDVRNVIAAMVARAGYTVLDAGTGEDALALIAERKHLAALVCDVVLCGMSGRQLAERVRALQPQARVLYVSGYTESAEAEELTAAGAGFLAKPFSERELVGGLQAALRGECADVTLRRLELSARFANGAAFLTAFDEATNTLMLANKPPRDDAEQGITLTIRFDDDGREFRVFGRLGPRVAEGMRMVFDPEEHTRRDLILACARGESIPYFRRAEPRFPARLEVRVRSETGLVIITHTQDISARGMMLTTDHRLEVGTMVALRIAFPDQSEPMTVAARIQSHVQHGARRGLGVEFQFASQDQRAFLAARIAALMAD